jgi:hypothetical protein
VRERLAGSPLLRWWGLSLLLAILTAIVWPTVPSYDPFSWVVWGREVTDPHISFFVGGGPSWKPLPFLFTTIYGALGSAAPALWVITARTGGIAGLIGAGRIAGTLCERVGLPRWAVWMAAVVSGVGVALTTDWSYYFFRGASEPLLIACALWAVDRAIAGRHWQAFVLLAAEGLMRPEAWPFLLLYGTWLFFGEPRVRAGLSGWMTPLRVLVVLGLVAQPVGWFVPPWISTGQPFLAATHASEYNGHLGANPFVTVVSRGESLQPLPALVLAAVAVLLAVWFGRERLGTGLPMIRRTRGRQGLGAVPLEVWLAAAVIGWWLVVIGMTLDGYPGLQRFFLPAAALTCALGAAGLVRVAVLVGGLLFDERRPEDAEARSGAAGHSGGRGGAVSLGTAATVVAAAVVAVLLAGSYHYVSPRITFLRQQEPLAAVAVTRIDQLGQAIDELGGTRALLPCRSSVVTINHSLQTALAWKLGTTLERVQTVLNVPGVAFVGPHDSIDGGPPPIIFKWSAHLIRTVGAWKIYQVDHFRQPTPACVGR